MGDFLGAVGCVFAVVAVAALVLFGIGLVGERMALTGALADIEALRAMSMRVDACESEDVMGQLAEANRRIAVHQAYNAKWWSAWVIPNAWDAVEPIPFPRRTAPDDL